MEEETKPKTLIEKNREGWDKILDDMDVTRQKFALIIRDPTFIFWSTVGRWVLAIGMLVLIFIMIKEIESVKILAGDACAICTNKTGAICTVFGIPTYP